ncbi:G-protein coupled receptor Mth2-like isoform X2 [Anoplolepis gracilipes]|uniref:G-protein coupled receptor Mth2-like isoform X2 n=1 Tax=Anoplolepis gracilipes TaxID=354296 RepID=UPI003B9F51DE
MVDNLTTRHKFHLNSMKDHDVKVRLKRHTLHQNYVKNNDGVLFSRHEVFTNSTINEDDSEQHELFMDFIKNHEDDNQMPIKLKNSTLYDLHQTFNSDDNKKKSTIVSYKMCHNNVTCIQLCCGLGDRLIDEKCVAEKDKYFFPNVYEYITNATSQQNENKRADELFQLVVHDPCQKTGHFVLNSNNYPDHDYILLANGSLYQPYHDKFTRSTSYCLAVVHRDTFDVIICNDTMNETINEAMNESTWSINEMTNESLEEWLIKQAVIFIIFNIVSLLFLLTTFVVYSILPELWTIHSYMLRRYVGSMFIGGTCYLVIQLIEIPDIGNSACFVLAFVTYFSLLASYSWLNVMSFDMWQTFRKLRPLQRNVKQEERKRIVLYSIYAWGTPLILVVICAIMEFVPNMSEDLIRPKFGVEYCWFNEDMAIMLYCYVPMSINSISSICLSIYTALMITRHEKKSVQQIRNLESRRHNSNKQWFNLYLKLFIVMFITMGINWTLVIASSMFENALLYVLYPAYLTDIMQNLCIFIIFVWKKKIKLLLLQRFGCKNCVTKTRQATFSGTSITTLEEISMDKTNSCRQASYANKSFDSTEF